MIATRKVSLTLLLEKYITVTCLTITARVSEMLFLPLLLTVIVSLVVMLMSELWNKATTNILLGMPCTQELPLGVGGLG